MSDSYFKLSMFQTEFFMFFPKSTALLIFCILVKCNCILLVAEAKSLGVIFDFSPSLTTYIQSVKSYWLYLHNITTILPLYIASSLTSCMSLLKCCFLSESQDMPHWTFTPTHNSLCPLSCSAFIP